MKKLKHKALLMLFMIIGSIAISSCDDNDADRIVNRLVYSEWEVELGRVAEDSEKLISVFQFNYDGSGVEKCYYLDGEPEFEYVFSWVYVRDYRSDYIALTFRHNREFLDQIYFTSNTMRAIHYLNEQDFWDGHNGWDVIFDEYRYNRK